MKLTCLGDGRDEAFAIAIDGATGLACLLCAAHVVVSVEKQY